MSFEQLLAKSTPKQTVVTHGTVTGIVARVLWHSFLSQGSREQLCHFFGFSTELAQDFVGYFTSLHDLGKIAPEFQRIITADDSKAKAHNTTGINYRHEMTTKKQLERIWRESGLEHRACNFYARILGIHHQGKAGDPERCNEAFYRLQIEYEQVMRHFFLKTEKPILPPDGSNCGCESIRGATAALLTGIIIFSDWLASGDLFFRAAEWEKDGTLEKNTKRQTMEFLKNSGLCGKEFDMGIHFTDVWPNIPKGTERQLQSETEALFKSSAERLSLVLMEAPMGEGKTEAGIYAASQMAKQWKKQGFYIALPTAATSNQMLARARSLFQHHHIEEDVRLLHSMAWIVDQTADEEYQLSAEDEQYARRWAMPVRRGLLAPYAVGTVDQAMMSALFVRYGVLRLLGLSGKVLIIDEVHAYDLYMMDILICLLQWCKALQIPVVLLSATLPPEKKAAFLSVYTKEPIPEAYPAVTAIGENGGILQRTLTKVTMQQTYTTELLPILHRAPEIAAAAYQKVERGGCCCVLVNTVKQAQEIYLCLKAAHTKTELHLFHAQFPARRRDEIEKTCIRLFGRDKTDRPQKAILIATQVVEQSLDVDFDYLISSVAPIDLLLQRLGREFRHQETPRPAGLQTPTFTVLIPERDSFGTDGYIYPKCLLRQSIHLLRGQAVIRVPEDLAPLVTAGYDSSCIPAEDLTAWLEQLAEDQLKASSAEQYTLGKPSKLFRPLCETADYDDLEQQSYLSAKTRLSPPSMRLALVGEELYDKLLHSAVDGRVAVKDKATALKIIESSVSVSVRKIRNLLQKSDLLDIKGDKLITGVQILPADNGWVVFDEELGIIWKEDEK